MHRIISVLLLAFSTVINAQDCSFKFTGSILDQHDDSPLSRAIISIEELNATTFSDERGTFSFDNICNGHYTIVVEHAQCKTKMSSIKVKDNTTKILRLEHHYEKLNEVIVSGSGDGFNQTVIKPTLSQEDIALGSNQSLGAMLSKVSGVSGLSSGNSIIKPSIHGLHSSRVTIINAGVRMEDQEWGAEHAPNLDVNQANSIEIIKNASALQYSGDAIGGFVIIKPQRIPIKDTLFGKARWTAQTNGQGGSLHAGMTKSTDFGWYGSLEGTFKGYGDFEAPDYILSNTGMRSNSVAAVIGKNQFKRGIELKYSRVENKIGILRASHLGGAQDQLLALNSEAPLIIRDFTYDIDRPKQEVVHEILSAKGYIKSRVLGKINVRYDYQNNHRLEFDIRRGSDQNKASMDLSLITQSISIDMAPVSNWFSNLKLGLGGRKLQNSSDPNTGVKRLIPDFNRYDLGAYVLAGKALSDDLALEFGARLDYSHIKAFKYYYTALWEERNYGSIYPDFVIEDLGTQTLTQPKFDYLNPSAAMGLNWSLNAQSTILLNLALGARNPNPSELFSEGLHHSASRIEIGDLRFTSEISKNISAGYRFQNNKVTFSIHPFLRFIDRFILLEPTGVQQTIRGNFQVWSYRQANVSLAGMDLDARVVLNQDVALETQCALVKSYEVATGTPLINMPPVNAINTVVYQNQNLPAFELRIESDHTWRQNEYPNTNFEAFIPESQSFELVDVSTPPDAYHLMNLEIRGQLKNLGKSKTILSLRVNNCFNVRYRNYLNSLRFYADDLGRNLLLSLTTNF